MKSNRPHFLVHAETYHSDRGAPRWKITIQSVGDGARFNAADCEPNIRRSRLELLAVVRGLEALDRPSHVTLLTRSRYVSHGIRRQLAQWREHHWQWERFGSVALIRDYDLWRRVDRALEFHSVECCVWQADPLPARKLRQTRPQSHFLPATLARFGRGVMTPLSHLWRPSFTRAA